RAGPAAREGRHLGHAPDGDAARAGDDSEGRTADRRRVPGRGLGPGDLRGGGPGAALPFARLSTFPWPVRGGLPDPEGREVCLLGRAGGGGGAVAGGGAAGGVRRFPPRRPAPGGCAAGPGGMGRGGRPVAPLPPGGEGPPAVARLPGRDGYATLICGPPRTEAWGAGGIGR